MKQPSTPGSVPSSRGPASGRIKGSAHIPDADLYQPLYSPWLGEGEFGRLRDLLDKWTLLSADRLWVLYSLASQATQLSGDFLEAGVYRGGTARLLKEVMLSRHARGRLHLFDTFTGTPEPDPSVDRQKRGNFSNTDVETIRAYVGREDWVRCYPGLIPDTFVDTDIDRLALAHIDVDLHKSILDTLAFVYPRVVRGGFLLFDDYGFPTCYGARLAVDTFFVDKPEVPLCLQTGQAVVIKLDAPHLP